MLNCSVLNRTWCVELYFETYGFHIQFASTQCSEMVSNMLEHMEYIPIRKVC